METMHGLSRRMFTKGALGSVMTYSLLDAAFRHDLFGREVKPITAKWLADLNDLGLAVKGRKLLQVEWQMKVEELFSKVDVKDLMQLIDFDRLTKSVKFVDNGARSIGFKFPKVEGLPTDYVFGKQIFALRKGRSVVPHGHNNMTTAFWILRGDLRGRHYDRVEDGEKEIIIRPTIDRKFGPGETSSISDHKDNVHWFQALTEPAYIFNIHVTNISRETKVRPGRVYLDPTGEKLKGGLIRASRIGYRKAHKLFG